MAAKRPSKDLIKKMAIVLVVLVVIQVAVLVLFKSNKAASPREAIERAVEKRKDLDASRKAQMRIQLALTDYRDKNGRYPDNLNQLIPDYFTSIPNDPRSNKAFSYKLEGGKYQLVGEAQTGGALDSEGTGGQQVITDATELTDDQRIALVSNLEKPEEQFIYDPSGKRDPFRPFDFAPKSDDGTVKTELEKYSIGQLKVTAILGGFEEPVAMVENEAGKGFRVKKGTKVGTNGGEVVEIAADRIMVLETTVDFTSQKKSKTIEMKIRTKDQESQVFPAPR